MRFYREVKRGNSEQLRGGEARLAGMGNVSEPLINLVSIVVPKLLIGINQTVYGRLSHSILGIRRHQTIGEEVDPNPVV